MKSVQLATFTCIHLMVNLALMSVAETNPPFSGKALRLYQSSSQQCHEELCIV